MTKRKIIDGLLKAPTGPECPFDHFVRDQLLRNPSTLKTRFDVLMAVFIETGGGYFWENGKVSSMSGNRKSAAQAERDFFQNTTPGTAEYNRRKLQLEQLDLVCVEPQYQSGGQIDALYLMGTFKIPLALATNVPDDAEDSFRRGVAEALFEASQCLYNAEVNMELERAAQLRRAMSAHIMKQRDALPKSEAESLIKAFMSA